MSSYKNPRTMSLTYFNLNFEHSLKYIFLVFLLLTLSKKTLARKLTNFRKLFCKNLNTKIILTPVKVGDLFTVKNAIPKSPSVSTVDFEQVNVY